MSYTERRKEQAQKTETAILNAALELMGRHGFDVVTVRDICKHAGITTGAFYHHFKSKEDLFDMGFAPLDDFMDEALREHPLDEPVARLKAVMEHYAQFMEHCGPLAAQYYHRRLNNPKQVSMDATKHICSVMEECFAKAYEQGKVALCKDPAWMARFCYCHFRGVVIEWLLEKREYSLRERMVEEFRMLEELFAPKKELL